jgi:hypothetical protein
VTANVFVEIVSVHHRLESLGLNETALRNAVTQGYLARTRLTPNHPRIFHGYSAWAETVASLRDQLRPGGWGKSDEGNYELTIHSKRELAIAAATGDEGTGLPHSTPSNKCPKGSNTIEAINLNNQIDLFQDLIPLPSIDRATFTTWILLYYFAPDEIRSELSLPSDIGTDGKIRGWKERIILRSIPLDGEPIDVRPPTSPDINIEIRRRA